MGEWVCMVRQRSLVVWFGAGSLWRVRTRVVVSAGMVSWVCASEYKRHFAATYILRDDITRISHA